MYAYVYAFHKVCTVVLILEIIVHIYICKTDCDVCTTTNAEHNKDKYHTNTAQKHLNLVYYAEYTH